MTIFRKDKRGGFVPFEETPFPGVEKLLEDWIEGNPHLLLEGEQIAIIGRQPRSGFGKHLDLLGVDESGACVVIELKRGETPRAVVAQTMEYAAWVDSLTLTDLDEIARKYAEGRGFEAERLLHIYRSVFEPEWQDGLEDEGDQAERVTFNTHQRLVIVAERFSPEVEQTLRYLRTKLGVDITGLRFGIHQAGEETLIETEVVVGRETAAAASTKSPGKAERHTDESIAERVETDFLRGAITALEEWVASLGDLQLEVRHRHRSTHVVFFSGKRLLVWYFAKRWMYFWLPDASEQEHELLLKGLTDPGSVEKRGSGTRFHAIADQDLDVVKKIIIGRMGNL